MEKDLESESALEQRYLELAQVLGKNFESYLDSMLGKPEQLESQWVLDSKMAMVRSLERLAQKDEQ